MRRFATSRRHITMQFAATALAVIALAVGTIPATATPATVALHLDGIHPSDEDYHQGTFTAPAPLCPSGTWQGNGQNSRVFHCADGSGTFIALFTGQLEHSAGAKGPWSIVAGTGQYVILRGQGTATVDSSTGPNSSPIRFSDTWTGVVDFDATPPTGRFSAVKVMRPHARGALWKVRVAFAAHDNLDGNPVSYHATATSGSFFARRKGTVQGGTTVLSFSLHVRRSMRRLEVEIDLADPVGNASTIRRVVKLQ